MNIRLAMGSALILGLLSVPVARADPPTSVQIEVNFLLGYLEGSRCEFYRNGTWHDSKAAQAHLRDKYKYLVARNLVNTTEQFIERGATNLRVFERINEKPASIPSEPRPARAGMSCALDAFRLAGYLLRTRSLFI